MKESEIGEVDSEGPDVTKQSSLMKEKKKKKKSREHVEIAVAREGEESGEDAAINKKSKKKHKEKKVDSESEGGVKNNIKDTHVDSEAEDNVNKSKKKHKETKVDYGADDDAKKSKKKHKNTKVDSEEPEVAEQTSLMKKKKKSREDGEIAYAREGEESGVIDKKSKKKNKEEKVDFEPVGGVKKKLKQTHVDSEAEDSVKKSKKQLKKAKVVSEADGDGKKKKKNESDGDETGKSESSEALGADRKTEKRKRDDCDLGAEENTDMSSKKRKKKKASSDLEVEETAEKKKQSKDSEVEKNMEKSSKKKKNTKEKKPSEDSEAEEIYEDANKEKKEKKKKQSKDSVAEENGFNSTKDAKKKKKKQGEEGNKDAKKKRKKEQKCSKNDTDVNTPSSKSTKKVKFSDQVETFPAEDEDEDEDEDSLVRGKRFSEEEDALIKKAVLDYVDNHALGEDGLKMVLHCQAHPQLRGCWKEIAAALPWRPRESVYNRAHIVLEAGSKGVWTKEDFELVKEFQRKHGNDWKTLADAMGKHRIHVKDAWRRVRLNMNKGHWSREEYQTLFDLVNKEIRMKAYKEKRSKHGMLRDDIPWMAISDELGTRNHVYCSDKWYDNLTSPMVAEGIWKNVDDYRLMEELVKLDAACIDDVDWDNLLENRDGDACRNRWNQMVRHVGTPRTKTFAEQVEILSERYCPDLAEDREDFDNRPFDPED